MLRTALLIGLTFALASAEFVIEVTRVTGNVQIKREESRKWETLEKGTIIEDNDVLQTSYKGSCEIRMNRDNILFLGSNSRILTSKVLGDDKKTTVSITLFSGSVYSKIVKQIQYTLYTSSALCRVDNAIFNCTVDEVSGITGFHVFKGDIKINNIAVQGEQALKSGETSTLAPNTAPSAPLKISARQMSILTRFYGAEFINQEIEATGLEVAAASGSPATAENKTIPTAEAQKPVTVTVAENAAAKEKAAKGFRVFSQNDAQRKLAEYNEEHNWMFQPSMNLDALGEYDYRAAFVLSQPALNGRKYPDYAIRPGLYHKNMSLVLNLSLAADSSGKPGFSVSGTRRLIEKLYSFDAAYRSNSIHAGDINDLTYGYGILLRNYTNRAYSDNVRNVGLQAHYEGYLWSADFFTSSLPDFHLIGLQYQSKDTLGGYGFTLIRDNRQTAGLNFGDYAYRSGVAAEVSALLPDSVSGSTSITAAEFQVYRNIFYMNPIRVSLYFTAAGFILNDKPNLKGFDLSLPGLEVVWGRQVWISDLYVERNRFTRGLFGPLYEDNLFSIQKDSAGAIQGASPLADLLPSQNMRVGLRLGYKVNPIKGITFSVIAEGLVFHFNRDSTDTVGESPKMVGSLHGRSDGSLEARMQIGGERFSRLNLFEAYYSIRHIGYFSNGPFALFAPNPFTTAGVRTRILIMRNVLASLGWDVYFYDANGDFKSLKNEKISSFSAGLTLGF